MTVCGIVHAAYIESVTKSTKRQQSAERVTSTFAQADIIGLQNFRRPRSPLITATKGRVR
jgi:hypothetical protein